MSQKASSAGSIVLLTLCAGQFLMMLDSSVMNVSMATVAAAAAVAVAAGPIIGGLGTTYLCWRYVFAGEVVVVAGILLFARRMEEEPKEGTVRLDLVGTALSALGLGLVVMGILKSGTWG